MSTIDVEGLTDYQIKLVRDFVESLKKSFKTDEDAFGQACGGWQDLIDEKLFLDDIYKARKESRREITL
ncbi:hypothetical protein ACFL27_15730 [candidate division CSSED10-310 bacterium]|uniref:Uncharacterized protein n=1 Tax=candidate division CSSED10-310 bacterium TaxID=2855610 RepID=A0ABV6YZN0_UNCC1